VSDPQHLVIHELVHSRVVNKTHDAETESTETFKTASRDVRSRRSRRHYNCNCIMCTSMAHSCEFVSMLSRCVSSSKSNNYPITSLQTVQLICAVHLVEREVLHLVGLVPQHLKS